jgi:predicted flap endonuclease-1-like 5' DNA nuclease
MIIFWSIVAFALTGFIIWLIFTDDDTARRVLRVPEPEKPAAVGGASAALAEKAVEKPMEKVTAPLEHATEKVDKKLHITPDAEIDIPNVPTEPEAVAPAERGMEIEIDESAGETVAEAAGEEAQAPEEEAGPAHEEILQEAATAAATMAAEASSLAGETKVVVPTTDNYPDDLTRINGIGDVYQGRLYRNGIFTWYQVAETPVAKLWEVTEAIPAAHVEDWPPQARRFAEEAGRLGVRYSGPMPDKLTDLPGVGPGLQLALRRHGVITYHQLANSSPEKLKAILSEAGANADPQTLIDKAKALAA